MSETANPILDGPHSRDGGTARLDAAARSLPRRRFFSDMPDKGLFAAVALTGFVGILLLKRYEVFGADVIAAMAVAVMALYGFASFQMPAVQIRPDRLGDNFYYLGFIFTLASLSAALLQLTGDNPDIRILLGNFGIALVTTVVGVAGRVLFVQMRGDIDEIEERVRRDLAATSADLRAQLVASLREFETFHTGVLQASNEAITKASRQAEVQIEQIGSVAEKASDRLNNKVDATDARGEKLATLLGRLSTTIGELPSLSNVELPSERLYQQMKSFSSEIELLIIELREAASQVRKRSQQKRRRWYWPFKRA